VTKSRSRKSKRAADVERIAIKIGRQRFDLELVNRAEQDRRTYRTAIGVSPYVTLSVYAVHVDCPASHPIEDRDCTCGGRTHFDKVLKI
jgi:hypothetical protein